MKRFFLLMLFFLSTLSMYAYSVKSPKSEKENNVVNVYSSGKETVSESRRVKILDGKEVLIILGIDAENKISFVSVKGDISEQNKSKMHELAAQGTCVTRCTRDNECSNKPTVVGAGICVSECLIDCIAEQF